MIVKVEPSGKEIITSWTDTAESLVKAAREAAFSQREYSSVSGSAGEIESDRFGWYTRSKEIAETAKTIGYQIEQDSLFGEVKYRLAF